MGLGLWVLCGPSGLTQIESGSECDRAIFDIPQMNDILTAPEL